MSGGAGGGRSRLPEVSELSPEQREVVDCWGRSLAVSAGAGSGKTTTLMVKCRELLRRDPEARICAVSFTERSAADLRAKMTELLRGQDLARHWVTTIHGFCGAILRENPREAGFSGDESVLSETEARAFWDRAVLTLWEDLGDPGLEEAVSRLLDRESRASLESLLLRCRELWGFGLLASLQSQREDPDAQALARVASHVMLRYARQKRRSGVIDFADLEAGADRALQARSVREAYHRRFGFIVVDEFQDTNAVQARIIRAFARPDLSNLCVVGDPKQSIYGFRDADVTVFNEFRLSLAERRSLTWNFRSRPGIIEFANRVGEAGFPASRLEFESLIARREPSEDPAGEVLILEVEEEEEGDEESGGSGPEARLAQWLLRQNAETGVPLGDYALLLRKVKGNESWLRALREAGIPIAVGSGGLLWEDPRARELVAFLQAWDQPARTLAAAVFLRAPWVGVDDREIDAWCVGGARDDGVGDAARRSPDPMMKFLDSRGDDHPVARVLRPLRGKSLSPSALLLELLEAPGLEEEIGAPLLGLWHRCEELSERGFDYQAVVTELAEACREKRRERELPPPAASGQVRILTLHASKGLEFPRVLLVDFAGKQRAQPAPLLFWDRAEGALLGKRDSEGERDPKHPLEVEWRARESAKSLAESKRLFYVALTRAREKLVLVVPAAAGTSEESVHAVDDWRAWVESCAEGIRRERLSALDPRPKENFAESAPPARAESGPGSGAPGAGTGTRFVSEWMRPRHSVTEWNALLKGNQDYARQLRKAALPEASSDPGQAWDARRLGNAVHAALEAEDADAIRAIEKEVGSERFSAEPLLSWMRASGHFSTDRHESWRELPFEVPVGSEVLLGVMDRVNRHKTDGTWSIIDYKVVETATGPAEALEKYRYQVHLYAWALGRLEPESRDRTRGSLVLIQRGEVTEVEVPLPAYRELDVTVGAMAERAARAVALEAREREFHLLRQ